MPAAQATLPHFSRSKDAKHFADKLLTPGARATMVLAPYTSGSGATQFLAHDLTPELESRNATVIHVDARVAIGLVELAAAKVIEILRRKPLLWMSMKVGDVGGKEKNAHKVGGNAVIASAEKSHEVEWDAAPKPLQLEAGLRALSKAAPVVVILDHVGERDPAETQGLLLTLRAFQDALRAKGSTVAVLATGTSQTELHALRKHRGLNVASLDPIPSAGLDVVRQFCEWANAQLRDKSLPAKPDLPLHHALVATRFQAAGSRPALLLGAFEHTQAGQEQRPDRQRIESDFMHVLTLEAARFRTELLPPETFKGLEYATLLAIARLHDRFDGISDHCMNEVALYLDQNDPDPAGPHKVLVGDLTSGLMALEKAGAVFKDSGTYRLSDPELQAALEQTGALDRPDDHIEPKFDTRDPAVQAAMGGLLSRKQGTPTSSTSEQPSENVLRVDEYDLFRPRGF